MKKTKGDRVYSVLYAVLLIILLAGVVFVMVQVQYLKVEQSQIKEILYTLSQYEKNSMSNCSDQLKVESSSFADEISFALGIISAGISVFAIFGGVLSVFNVVRSKDLDDAIKMSSQAIDNQQELECARLIQEGRMYASRKRNKYAVDCYEQAIDSVPGSFMALVAEYEIFSLSAEELPCSAENRLKLERAYREIIKKLDKCPDKRAKTLKADTFFVMGCAYGVFYLKFPIKDVELLDLSVEFMSKSIECDKGNVDFYRNLAVTYALKGNEKKCEENLMKAQNYAKAEELYTGLIETSRLGSLFEPAWEYLSNDIKRMLGQKFGIFCKEKNNDYCRKNKKCR